jgi:hypothetical protein
MQAMHQQEGGGGGGVTPATTTTATQLPNATSVAAMLQAMSQQQGGAAGGGGGVSMPPLPPTRAVSVPSLAIMHNTSGYHALPAYLTEIRRARARLALGLTANNDKLFTAKNHPLPLTSHQVIEYSVLSAKNILCISINASVLMHQVSIYSVLKHHIQNFSTNDMQSILVNLKLLMYINGSMYNFVCVIIIHVSYQISYL